MKHFLAWLARAAFGFTIALGTLGAYWLIRGVSLNFRLEAAMQAAEVVHHQARALEVTAPRLPDFEEEVGLVEAKAEKLSSLMPEEPAFESLLATLPEHARLSQVRCELLGAPVTTTRDFHREVDFELSVSGSSRAIGQFLGRVARTVRPLVSVGHIALEATARDRFEGQLSLVTFADQPQPSADR